MGTLPTGRVSACIPSSLIHDRIEDRRGDFTGTPARKPCVEVRLLVLAFGFGDGGGAPSAQYMIVITSRIRDERFAARRVDRPTKMERRVTGTHLCRLFDAQACSETYLKISSLSSKICHVLDRPADMGPGCEAHESHLFVDVHQSHPRRDHLVCIERQ